MQRISTRTVTVIQSLAIQSSAEAQPSWSQTVDASGKGTVEQKQYGNGADEPTAFRHEGVRMMPGGIEGAFLIRTRNTNPDINDIYTNVRFRFQRVLSSGRMGKCSNCLCLRPITDGARRHMNSVILINGASSGFGVLAARALAGAGYTLCASVHETTGRNATQVVALRKCANENLVGSAHSSPGCEISRVGGCRRHESHSGNWPPRCCHRQWGPGGYRSRRVSYDGAVCAAV